MKQSFYQPIVRNRRSQSKLGTGFKGPCQKANSTAKQRSTPSFSYASHHLAALFPLTSFVNEDFVPFLKCWMSCRRKLDSHLKKVPHILYSIYNQVHCSFGSFTFIRVRRNFCAAIIIYIEDIVPASPYVSKHRYPQYNTSLN